MMNKQQLAQSEKQFRNLFEQNNDIIIVLSPDGSIQKMNDKGVSVFEFDPSKVDKTLFDLDINYESKSHSERVVEALNNREEVSRYTKQYMVRFNHKRDFEVSVSPIYDDADKLIEIVAILRDITQRIAYENELLRQQERAEESDRLKTAFLMNMSHEIRTPLNAVMGFTQLLISTPLSDKQSDYLEYIKQGGKRLEHAVTDILEASALQKNQFVVTLRKYDINVLLQEVYNKAQHRYASKLDKINFSLHNMCDADLRVETDGAYLRKVLLRILDNAFKFTSVGEIDIVCRVSETQISISIKDTGCGINPQKLKVIFEYFRQGEESLTRGFEGLGLGLPISKGILNKLGYAININSTPNVGTDVVISIPRLAVLSTTNIQPLRKKKKVEDKLYSVLVVEDNVPSGLLLTKLLKDRASSIDVAQDGAACKYYLKKNAYDIAFVDIKLPDYSGYDLIPIIRKAYPKCKICVQSAFADQIDINKALKLGATSYITKPVSKSKIISFFAKISM